jgi:putative thioredoxin
MNTNPQPVAGGPPPSIIEASDRDFQVKVLERSLTVPVLVDFWAPWCGPCKVIGPVLEKLAREFAGRFELCKVNMDENPMLAQALMIQSIPAVKLFVNAEIKDEFVGAYPEPEMRRFLEANLPTAQDTQAVQGLNMRHQGHPEDAAQAFQAVLEREPDNAVALVGMGHHYADHGDVDHAKEMVTRVNAIELDRLPDAKKLGRELDSLKAKLFLMDPVIAAKNGGGASSAPELDTVFLRSCEAALQGKASDALEGFLSLVRKDRKYREDGGRKGMLAVFSLLPPDSPLIDNFRSKLSSILFA